MEKTLVIFKPSSIERGLVGEILARFQKKGLIIAGIKMMQRQFCVSTMLTSLTVRFFLH